MNVLKNMEAIFLVSAVLLCAAGYASATPVPLSVPASKMAIADGAHMQIVSVHAKRLSAAEKAAL
ncbi:hypothetical protein [Rugamonas sp.]|uniref:hypothetical protein n=1 Tax=Rugamonas sp. TaxID=1926287 RepID=UPI0025E15BC1|nr:hypothetical protein [Rugamonas sp.]